MRPISICMPYWNRPAELERSLRAYDRLYPDLDFCVFICDDGSSQPPQIPASLQDRVRVETLPRKTVAMNPCVPINVAVRNACTDVIVLTNPEIEHRERVFDQMLDALQGPNDYVMAPCRDNTAGEWYAGPQAPRCPVGGRQPIPPGTSLHFCVMFHRELYERAQGFDESYRQVSGCDDNDWLWRVHALGDVNFKHVDGVVWHYRTPHRGLLHRWTGTPEKAAALLEQKWGHLPEFRACVS